MNKGVLLDVFFFFFYLSPGKSHRGGSNHQQGPLVPVVGCYADGLHSLSQAHVISQEEAALFRHCKTTPKHQNKAREWEEVTLFQPFEKLGIKVSLHFKTEQIIDE